MTVIVTGATGFIGRHLVDALAASGREVRCLTRGTPAIDSRPNVSYHQARYDRHDLGLSDDVMAGADTVYHLAGATRAVGAAGFAAANVETTTRLLDNVMRRSGSPRFVLVSSQAAAGPARDAEHPKRESDPEAPIEDYGRSKLAAERAVRDRAGELPVTILRPAAVYGPGDRDFLSIFSMMKRGLAVYPGIRKSSVNTIYVEDLVTALIAASSASTAVGQTYFLGDDEPRSWKEIYATIGDVVGSPQPVEFSVPRGAVAAAGAIGDLIGSVTGRPSLVNSSKALLAAPRYWLCTSKRAREDFAFAPTTPLRAGIKLTYDWYVKNRWL